MSKEAFETVIGKAVVEAEFRGLLLADPDQALAGFALTEEETSILKKIDDETLEALSSALDERIRIRAQARDPRLERNGCSPDTARDCEPIPPGPQATHHTGKTGPLELLKKILINPQDS